MPVSPRTIELPFVMNNIKPGNILNIGGAGGEWKWKLVNKHPMTIVDIRKPPAHKKIKSFQSDIRKLTPKQTGCFDNIILMSTLEHISLKTHDPNQKGKGTWNLSPREEQLKVFKHCMKFLKPGGHMIFTVPCGVPIKNPIRKLHYNTAMLNDLKKEYKVLKEFYYKRPNNEWIKCNELPKNFFKLKEETNMQENNAITRALQLMIITNK